MRRIATAALLALVACGADGPIRIDPSWPEDHTAVILALDGEEVVFGPRLSAPGRPPPDVPTEAGRALKILVFSYPPQVRAPNGARLEACGVRLGGRGAVLPAPVFAFDVPKARPGTKVRPAPIAGEPPGFDLRFASCGSLDDACEAYELEELDLPDGVTPFAVTAFDSHRALVGGGVLPGLDRAAVFVEVDGASLRTLPPRADVPGPVRSLAFDHVDRVYGVRGGGAGFAIETGGARIPLEVEVTAEQVRAGRDGTVLFFDRTATTELLAGGRFAVTRNDLPTGLVGLDLLDGARIAGVNATELRLLVQFNRRTYPVEAGAVDVAIDDGLVAVLRAPRTVEVLTGADLVPIAQPVPRGTLRALVSMGRGRLAVGGTEGSLFVWSGRVLCELGEATPDFTWWALAAAPSGTVAYAIGRWDTAAGGRLARIRTPGAPPTP